MASCKYNPRINSVNPYAVLNVTQQSQSVATNKTMVRYELLIYRPSSISSSASKAYTITINETKVKSGTTTIGGSGTKTIASGTLEIPHNSDGTKNISFSFSLTFDITWHGKWVGTGNASGNMSLTTIPRATTARLNPSEVYLGSTINIDLSSRASTSFTHNLYWRFGELTGTIGTGIATSASLRTDKSWASQIPNGNSGVGYIYCDTFNGSTKIGAKTVSFTARVSTGYEPVINNINISEAVSGIYNQFYTYVQNKSKLQINISANGTQGATIKTYKTTVCGITYSGNSFVTSEITKSGNVEIAISVTDSRGLTTTTTRTINVQQYFQPKINSFVVERGDSDNSINSVGTYAIMKINFEISRVNNRNRNSYKIEYKLNQQGSSWNLLGTYSGYSFNGIKNGGNILSGSSTYSFRLTVSDFFGNVEAVYDNIPTSSTLFNVNKEGTSICFGAVSKRGTERCYDFECPIYAKESVLPYDGENADIGSITNPFNNGYFKNLYINGKNHSENKILWSGGYFMTESHTATLNEPISAQIHGIILVFTPYIDNQVKSYDRNPFFVPKQLLKMHNGQSMTFTSTASMPGNIVANKCLIMSDTKIGGHKDNVFVGKVPGSGIYVQNNKFVLQYVIGI